MNPRDALKGGDVRLAMDLLKAEIRRAPRDGRLRIFLFQMFCITGEWDRALTQLTVAGELDPAASAMVQTYQVAIRCEVLREKVFRGERNATVLGDPGDWLPLLIEANRLLAEGASDRATTLRDAAFEQAPPAAGTLDGEPCEWVADADPRLGPVLEAIVDGKYVWVPYHRIRHLRFEPPEDLRDQVWMPVRFTWTNEGEAVGFIPTRYPGSATAPDPLIQLARATAWHDAAPGWSLPLGQRVLVTDAAETALMDIRHLALDAK